MDECSGNVLVSEQLRDMRFVHRYKKNPLEPALVTHRVESYRKMRADDPTRFIAELHRLEKEFGERADAEIAAMDAEEAKQHKDKPKATEDTAHCVALVEKLIADWHEKHPGALEMKP
jgi:hypothetical protein